MVDEETCNVFGFVTNSYFIMVNTLVICFLNFSLTAKLLGQFSDYKLWTANFKTTVMYISAVFCQKIS